MTSPRRLAPPGRRRRTSPREARPARKARRVRYRPHREYEGEEPRLVTFSYLRHL